MSLAKFHKPVEGLGLTDKDRVLVLFPTKWPAPSTKAGTESRQKFIESTMKELPAALGFKDGMVGYQVER